MKKISLFAASLAAITVAASPAGPAMRSAVGSSDVTSPMTVISSPFRSRVLPAQEAAMKIAPRKAGPLRAKAKDVPFIEDFSTPDNLGDWGIQDVNNDNSSWEYKQSFGLVQIYFAAGGGDNDDWLVTPAINLGKDDVYTLTFSYGSQGSRYKAERLAVTMGTSEYATRHTTLLYEDNEIQNFWNGSMRTVTITLPVEEDAPYYFGFHCTTPSGGYCLYLDDIRVEQNGTKAAPDAVTSLTVTPGAKGAPEATVACNAPEVAADGSALTEISAIKVYRDDIAAAVHTFTSPAPGEELSFTDTDLTTGNHTWRLVPELDGQEGARAEVSAYIGIDIPMAVTNLSAAELASGAVALTWDAPAGVNGGYTGADAVTYKVTRTDGATDTVLAEGLRETSFTDTSVDTSVQSYQYYLVEASTVTGTSEVAESNSLFTGPAYTVPFKENFAYGTLAKSPWVMETVVSSVMNPTWSIVAQGTQPVCPPIDGDDGMLAFNTLLGGLNFYQGAQVRLATPAISLKDTTDPYITFWLFHYDTTQTSQEYNQETEEYETVTYTYNDKVKVQIAVDNGAYTDIPDAEIELAANNGGWTRYRVSLAPYKGAEKASVGLLGMADGGGNIHVDGLLITDTYASDLEITDILGPQSCKAGEEAKYLVRVVNNGATSTKAYTVDLCVDGKPVQTLSNPGAAIFANGGEKLFRFTFTPQLAHSGAAHTVTARINCAADMCPANDLSDAVALEVPAMDFPAVTEFNGLQTPSEVTLAWEEPDFASYRSPRRDDLEKLNPFIISGIADYTLIDNDKSSETYCISGIDGYDNARAAMAYQVFNPEKAGVDLEEPFNRRWYARSGSQMLVSWGASQADANDDWLISPELSGEEQVVSFYVKSITMAYTERFRVLYSRDTKSISDFVKVAEANYYTPGGKWRKFSVRLPEGAKYFAIHCISADAFGLMVDDISFEPRNASAESFDLMGYNIYRDGEKLNSEPLTTNSYTDTGVPAGQHSYFVTTVYASGESSPSPVFVAAETGIAAPESDDAASEFLAIGHEGCLELYVAQGTRAVSVFTADGRRVLAENVSGSSTFALPAGVYFVTSGADTRKVLVK